MFPNGKTFHVKRCDLIQAFVAALPIQAIVVLAGPSGMSGVCLGPPGDDVPFETFWFAKKQHAELVLAQCPEGWCALMPAALRDEVINAAAALGAAFRTAAEVEADASKAVEEIIMQVENRRQNGDLAKVNRDYKIYRQAQVARGLKAVSYSTHLATFTRSLVVLAAQNAEAR